MRTAWTLMIGFIRCCDCSFPLSFPVWCDVLQNTNSFCSPIILRARSYRTWCRLTLGTENMCGSGGCWVDQWSHHLSSSWSIHSKSTLNCALHQAGHLVWRWWCEKWFISSSKLEVFSLKLQTGRMQLIRAYFVTISLRVSSEANTVWKWNRFHQKPKSDTLTGDELDGLGQWGISEQFDF